MIFGIDFDGTCVTHEYPKVGRDIDASIVLKKIIDSGHQLILFTMRSGKELDDAVNWFKQRNIPLYGIQTNPTQKAWTSSPKAYCNVYIDDAALGCPLIKGDHNRPYVDWLRVEHILQSQGYIH